MTVRNASQIQFYFVLHTQIDRLNVLLVDQTVGWKNRQPSNKVEVSRTLQNPSSVIRKNIRAKEMSERAPSFIKRFSIAPIMCQTAAA